MRGMPYISPFFQVAGQSCIHTRTCAPPYTLDKRIYKISGESHISCMDMTFFLFGEGGAGSPRALILPSCHHKRDRYPFLQLQVMAGWSAIRVLINGSNKYIVFWHARALHGIDERAIGHCKDARLQGAIEPSRRLCTITPQVVLFTYPS